MKNNKMIKAFAILLALLMAGCSAPKPGAVAESYLKGMKSQIKETLGESLGSDPDGFFGGSEENEKKFYELIGGYDYKIVDEVIDGDRADVDVEITTYDFGSMFMKFIQDYFVEALSLSYSGAGEEEIEAAATKVFTTSMEDMEKEGKTFTEKVTVGLYKENGKWMVDEQQDADALTNAVAGGMIKALESLSQLSFE